MIWLQQASKEHLEKFTTMRETEMIVTDNYLQQHLEDSLADLIVDVASSSGSASMGRDGSTVFRTQNKI